MSTVLTASKIVIIDDDGALAAQVRAVMGASGPRVDVETCSDVDRLPGLIARHGPFHVVVAGPGMATRAQLLRLKEVRDDYPGTAIVLAFGHRPTAPIRELVRTGSCDLLRLPVPDQDLEASLVRALELSQVDVPAASAAASLAAWPAGGGVGSPPRQPGKVFTTSSATGGCGKTFLATNLAFFLSRHTGQRTCVVDLDLQFGEVTTALRLRPRYTIFDALQRQDSDDDDLRANLDEYVVQHDTGFWVLAAPKEPSEADHISSPDVTRILEAARSRFDYVVVDTPAALTEVVLAAFDLSDTLYTMATLDVPSVRNMGVFLNQLERLKIPSDNIRLILNKAEKNVGIDVDQVSRLFPKQFSAVLPYAREVSRSINLGMPVMASDPTATVSQLMAAGLRELLPPEAQAALDLSNERPGLFRRMFKR